MNIEKTIKFTLGIGVAVCLISAVVFVYYDYKQREYASQQPVPIGVNLSESQINIEREIPSSWKTYKNENLKFSIEYPPDLIVEETPFNNIGNSVCFYNQDAKQAMDSNDNSWKGRYASSCINVFKSLSDFPYYQAQSFKELVDNGDEWGFYERKEISLDGIKGYEGKDNEYQNMVLMQKDYIYDISPADEEFLSTFRFID